MLVFIKNHMILFKLFLLLLLVSIIGLEIFYTKISTSVEYHKSIDNNVLTVVDSHGPDTRIDELDSMYFVVDGESVEALVNEETILNQVGLTEGKIEYDIVYESGDGTAIITEIRY